MSKVQGAKSKSVAPKQSSINFLAADVIVFKPCLTIIKASMLDIDILIGTALLIHSPLPCPYSPIDRYIPTCSLSSRGDVR